MKLSRSLNSRSLILIAVLAVGFAGCATQPRITKIPKGGGAKNGSDQYASGTSPLSSDSGGLGTRDLTGGVPLADPSTFDNMTEDPAALQAYTVHFEYDSSTVRAGEESKLSAVAEQLKGRSGTAVRIAGHCDERGTEEYNRSLGERRALALREKLLGLGIGPNRIDTRSYGEDKPVDPSHNEAAWARNRRGEFILLLPKSNT
jgi:peptidoglycan-associated lipoprotein